MKWICPRCGMTFELRNIKALGVTRFNHSQSHGVRIEGGKVVE